MDYKELKQKAEEDKERKNLSMKEHYQLARSLGFTAWEAARLTSTSDAAIHRLAKEKEQDSLSQA